MKHRKFLYLSGVFIAVVAALAFWWSHRWGHYLPSDAYRDVVAAMQVGDTKRPVERFLEIRYGAMDNAQNRQKAFQEFFNVDHIEGLYQIVNRLPPETRQARIEEMARWVAQYRQNLSPSERQSLKAYFESETGRAAVRQARIQYMKKDHRFRADAVPVIQEMMLTLHVVQNP